MQTRQAPLSDQAHLWALTPSRPVQGPCPSTGTLPRVMSDPTRAGPGSPVPTQTPLWSSSAPHPENSHGVHPTRSVDSAKTLCAPTLSSKSSKHKKTRSTMSSHLSTSIATVKNRHFSSPTDHLTAVSKVPHAAIRQISRDPVAVSSQSGCLRLSRSQLSEQVSCLPLEVDRRLHILNNCFHFSPRSSHVLKIRL